METSFRFDKNLKQLLEKRKKSVQWLGQTTGIPTKTIYHWLNGQHPSNFVQVKKISDAFNISLEELIFEKAPELQVSDSPQLKIPLKELIEMFEGKREIVLTVTIERQLL